MDRAIIEASGLFDADFYVRLYRDLIPAGVLPLDHYLSEGEARGLLASTRFDPIVYKLRSGGNGDGSPLLMCAHRGDRTDYRNIASLLPDIRADAIRVTFSSKPGWRGELSAGAADIAGVIGRSARINRPEFRCELHNPSVAAVLSKLDEDRPFAFARLPHGFWDGLCAQRKLAAQLAADPRCRGLSQAEIDNVALRLLAREQLPRNNGSFIEDMFRSVLSDLVGRPMDPEFWTAISLTGAPAFADALYGLDDTEMSDRLSLIARYLRPDDRLYDATMWKRWAVSGDLARLAETTRRHPVIMIGPQKFRTLRQKWRLDSYRHVAIGPRLSQLTRHALLDRAATAVEAAIREPAVRHPVVLLQAGGSLSYWLISRLRTRYPDVFYLDMGQALDVWYWTQAPWMSIFEDTLKHVNTFPMEAASAASGDVSEQDAEVTRILEQDYLQTGLMASL